MIAVSRPSSPRPSSPRHLRRKARQSPPYLALAETFECAVPELSDALPRYAEHRADFLERVFPPAVEAEVEAQHLRVARRERAQRPFDLVGKEPVHRKRSEERRVGKECRLRWSPD